MAIKDAKLSAEDKERLLPTLLNLAAACGNSGDTQGQVDALLRALALAERSATRAELMTVGGLLGWYRQTLDSPFSAVSKPTFPTKASFCCIKFFRDLHD